MSALSRLLGWLRGAAPAAPVPARDRTQPASAEQRRCRHCGNLYRAAFVNADALCGHCARIEARHLERLERLREQG